MSVYQKYLTVGNSAYRNVIEPSGGDTGNDYMRVGNNSSGAAYWILIKLPTDLPSPAQVSNAILRLTEYNSDYRGDGALTMHIARTTGAWTTSTNFNALPAYDTSNVVDFTFDSNNNPDSNNWDGRADYRPTQYKYKKYKELTGEYLGYEYFSDYRGTEFNDFGYIYKYYSTISAYYDDYWVWHDINITNIIQDCVDKGDTGLLLYFTLPGANNTRKYIRTPLNASTDWQPRLTITYASDEPTKPPAPTFTMGTKGYIDLSSRTSSGLTHTLRYAFGARTGTIATKTTSTSYGWTPAIDIFAPQVTNAASGSGTLYCDTYSGSTLIGTKAVTLTMKVPTTLVPTVTSLTATNKSSNATVDGWSEFVKGYSCAELKATANTDAAYGSTISSYKFEVLKSTTVKYSTTVSTNVKDTSLFNEAGTGYSFKVTVTDSRGMTAIKTIEGYTVYDYYIPTISAVDVFRCDVNGVKDMEKGTYASAKGTFTISSVNGKNTISVSKIEYKTYAASVYNLGINSPVSGTANVIGAGGIDTSYAYDIRFCLKDLVSGEVYNTVRIKPAFVTMHVKKYGKGIGFGGAATADEMQVYMPAVFKDTLKVGDKNVLLEGTDAVTFLRLRLTATDDVSKTSTLHAFQIGADNAANIRMDNNEIQAMSNGATANLNLNVEGGGVKVNGYTAWHSGNDGAGSGLDADKLDGYGTSDGYTGTNIPLRDSAGDIKARLFRSNYANASSMSGAIAFRKTTSDNYIRFCSSPYGVRSWLQAGQSRGGTVTLNDDYDTTVNFTSMVHTPRIQLTAQTSNTGVVTAKVRAVTTTYFKGIIGGSASTSLFAWDATDN